MTLPTITGEFRLAADPELRFSPTGVAVASLRAVASSRKKLDSGDWVDDKTCWVTMVAFKQLAENIAETLMKGTLVSVQGRLEVSEWEDRDGHKRQTPQILIDHIGPSLAWATAKVTKTERQGGGNSGGGGFDRSSSPPVEDPWSTAPPAGDEPPF